MTVTSFLSHKLERSGLMTGAFLFVSLLPVVAVALTGPESGEPAVIVGLGRVVDGDTLDVGSTRVRLEGIDAPEMAQTCQTATGESWDCGKKATAYLRSLAEQRNLACDRTGTDKYRRTLAVCYEDGINVNEAMVRAGLAWAFVRYSTQFVDVEAEARAQKIGVWQGPAEAPWDFRHSGLQVAAMAMPKSCSIKGNISSHGHIYHLPDSPWYGSVKIDESRGERWFCSEDEARAAGWRPAAGY